MTDNNEKFWLVWRDNGGSPNRRHRSKEDALIEAGRLSKNHIGIKFYVLEGCSYVFSVAHTNHVTLREDGDSR